MGVSYVSVVCSLDALASVYSSRDEALFRRVVASRDSGVRHYLSVAGEDGGRPPAEPLAEVFRGAQLSPMRPHVYAYALLAYALVLGERAGELDCAYRRAGRLSARLASLGERDAVIPVFCDAWPLPDLALGDHPMCTTLRAEEVARLATETRALLERVGPRLVDEDDDLSLELLAFFTECYEAAARRGSDLLMVAH